jgi:hypothetical protein
MTAYLAGRFAEAVASLERWASSEAATRDASMADLAAEALSKVGELSDAGHADPVARSAASLATRLRERPS